MVSEVPFSPDTLRIRWVELTGSCSVITRDWGGLGLRVDFREEVDWRGFVCLPSSVYQCWGWGSESEKKPGEFW